VLDFIAIGDCVTSRDLFVKMCHDVCVCVCVCTDVILKSLKMNYGSQV
jgi:hypothetical protein